MDTTKSYIVIQTVLVDATPFPPALRRVSVTEFETWIEAAKFGARRPDFHVLNKTVDADAVAKLMALPLALAG